MINVSVGFQAKQRPEAIDAGTIANSHAQRVSVAPLGGFCCLLRVIIGAAAWTAP